VNKTVSEPHRLIVGIFRLGLQQHLRCEIKATVLCIQGTQIDQSDATAAKLYGPHQSVLLSQGMGGRAAQSVPRSSRAGTHGEGAGMRHGGSAAQTGGVP
jgi:hypothetical protein